MGDHTGDGLCTGELENKYQLHSQYPEPEMKNGGIHNLVYGNKEHQTC